MELENKPRLYVVMTQDILCRKDISPTAKLVFARMSGFEEFYESPEKTAEILGKSRGTIVNARQELEKVGLIRCVRNTGRGKAFCVVLDSRLNEKVESDYTKQCSQTTRNNVVEYKVENKEKNISKDIVQDAQKDEQKEYGNQQVNELLKAWEIETGVEANSSRANRLAAYNLIRSKGFDEALRIVKLCGRAMRSKDQFVPIVSSFKDLQGRYEKLSKLIAWEKRQQVLSPTPVYRPRVDVEPEFEISDEERKANLAKIREMRKKIGI